MAQEIGRRSVTVEAWIRFQISPCEMVGRRSCSGSGFLSECFGFPLSISYITAPYSASTCCSYEEEKQMKPWNFQIAVLTQKWERWIKK